MLKLKLKHLVLATAVATAFLVGYAGASQAWPGVPDRDAGYGYFFNVGPDTSGGNVIQNGFPSYVDSHIQLINYINGIIASGSARDRIGAEFIVQTMLGSPYSRNRPPSPSEMADWEARVTWASNHGLVNWFENYTYNVNTLWQGSGSGANPNDDTFYFENGTRQAMVFRNPDGSVAYVIKRDCGNPLMFGGLTGLKTVWSVVGTSTVSNPSPLPGQTIVWDHYLQNNGPSAAYSIWQAIFDGPSSSPTGLPTNPSNTGDYAAGERREVKQESLVVPNNAAAGTKYCRLVGWSPVDSDGNIDGRGQEACATVNVPTRLIASSSVSPASMAPGETAVFSPAVRSYNASSSVTVNCHSGYSMYPPPGGGSPYALGNLPCTTTSGDPNIVVPPNSTVQLNTFNYTAPDNVPIGSYICRGIFIDVPSSPSYYESPDNSQATSCVLISKQPYVNFLGGDVWAGGSFAVVAPGCTSVSKIGTVTRGSNLADGSRPGSGVEYGAFASGRITNFGSAGMALVNATGVGDAWTFSNINTTYLGYFGGGRHCITDYIPTYQSATALGGGSTIDVGGRPSGAWHVTGGLTIHGTMPAGSRQVYYADGDVDIDANLVYPGSFANAAAIPSLVVITKGHVHVWSGVTQVDGIFEVRGDGGTSGNFYTCWPKTVPATTTTCPTQLTVNGSVLAAGLDLHRTAGAEGATPAQQKSPAEVFNLSPEVYITNALNPTGQTTLTTSTIRELPPRF